MQMKRIIMGATSGIGRCTAERCIAAGWQVGAAGRRTDALEQLRQLAPERVFIETIDITDSEALTALERLIVQLGGMDIYLHVSGVGSQNPQLDPAIEFDTIRTNVEGFTRMVTTAYRYFATKGGGHLAVISSIASTKGLGVAASYSATKRYQNIYIDALDQLAHMNGQKIRFTDIRPGFVATPLLHDGRHYPMLLTPKHVAARIFKALVRDKRRVTIDWRYAVLVFLWRLIPSGLWARLPIRNRPAHER